MGERTFDLTGRRFGKLTVISFDRYEAGSSWWLCRCDCGGEKVVKREYLQNGHTWSCGCARGKGGNYDPEAFRHEAISPEAGEWIRKHFKHTKNDEIKAKFGISDGALHRFARATGKIEVLKYEDSQLLSLQKAVDGYIEVVPLPGDPGLVLIADEEGLFKKKPLNLLATEMVRNPIVGDVVLMERKQLD